MIKNARNLLPYLLLIVIYFFFVNLEAKKDKTNYLNSEKENLISDDEKSLDDKNLRIAIPVIPYNQ